MGHLFKESLKYYLRSEPFIRSYVREIDAMYGMKHSELRSRNEQRFLAILRQAYDKSPFYHRLYDEAQIDISKIKGLEDIDSLPVVTKEMVKQYGLEMTTCPHWKLIRNHTSGTTGSQLNVWEDWESIWREQASLVCYRKRCGFRYGKDVLASLRGTLDKKSLSLWVGASKTLFLSSYHLRPETTQKYVEAIQDKSPKAIEGFPSSLYALACNIEELGLHIEIPICFTSSENMLKWMRKKIETVFHTQLFDHYGLTERTIQIFESPDHTGYFESPGYSINEYLDDCTITTSLINKSFPLIRYRVSDVMELLDDMTATQDLKATTPTIKAVKGRAMLFISGKDGTLYSDSALTFILKDCESAKYTQFIQYEDGHVDMNIVTFGGEFPQNDRQRVMDLLEQTIGLDNIDIRINEITEKELIYTSRGKFSLVVNKRAQSPNNQQ